MKHRLVLFCQGFKTALRVAGEIKSFCKSSQLGSEHETEAPNTLQKRTVCLPPPMVADVDKIMRELELLCDLSCLQLTLGRVAM